MRPPPDIDGANALDRQRERTALAPVGVFEAAPGSVAARVALHTRSWHPAAVALAVTLAGGVLLGAFMVGLGLLLTHVLQGGALLRWEAHVNTWFVTERSPAGNSITSVATTIGSTQTVLIVTALSVIVLAIRRLWREIEFVVLALTLEVLVFLSTTVLVDRRRPAVPHLDPAPPTSSFPSGHTAAAIALWVSLAIVFSMHTRKRLVRTVAWVLAMLIASFVGLSRLYRGMHHPTDVVAGVVLGGGAVLIALFAVRASWTGRQARNPSAGQELSDRPADAEVAS